MWLKAGVMEEMQRPEGNDRHAAGWSHFASACEPLSALAGPTLGDERLRRATHDAHIVRYADDFVILCSQRPEVLSGPGSRRFLTVLVSR